MRVIVFVFFHAESLVVGFQADGDEHVCRAEPFGGAVFGRIVFFFHVTAAELGHFGYKTSLAINQRQNAAFFIFYTDKWHTGCFGSPEVVGAEVRRRVYHAGTVFGGNKVGRDHAEAVGCEVFVHQFGHGQQLFVTCAYKFFAFKSAEYTVGQLFSAGFETFERLVFVGGIEVAAEPFGGEDDGYGIAGVRTQRGNFCVFDVGSYAEGHVGGKGPGCGRPGEDAHIFVGGSKQMGAFFFVANFKHGHHRSIGYLFVAAGHVEFVGGESGAGGG